MTTALIVGAGPAGLVLAHELARFGLDCRLIEQAEARPDTSRAIAIHARTLEMLVLMRATDAVLARGHRIRGGALLDSGATIATLRLDALDSPYPFVISLPQSETETILEAAAARHGVRLERGTRLVDLVQDADGVTCRLQRADGAEEVRADWVIGCDGAHSTVRHALGMAFAGAEYPEQFVLADVEIADEGPRDLFRLYGGRGGLLAAFPLPGARWRLIAELRPEDAADAPEGAAPTLEQWQAVVDRRGAAGWRLAALHWSTAFRIHRRHVAQLRQGRVFLAGDAAHIHSPAGGQGMNTSIQDAFNLGWKLAMVVSGDAGPALLDSYEAERLPVIRGVIARTDRLTRFAGVQSAAIRWLRDQLLPLALGVQPVQAAVAQAISQIAVAYRHSPVVEDHAVPGRLHAGDRAPDAPVWRDGAATQLYRLLGEGRHVLLRVGDPAAPTGLLDRRLRHAEAEPGTPYGEGPACYLIRPDGYVGLRCRPDAAASRLPAFFAQRYGG